MPSNPKRIFLRLTVERFDGPAETVVIASRSLESATASTLRQSANRRAVIASEVITAAEYEEGKRARAKNSLTLKSQLGKRAARARWNSQG